MSSFLLFLFIVLCFVIFCLLKILYDKSSEDQKRDILITLSIIIGIIMFVLLMIYIGIK